MYLTVNDVTLFYQKSGQGSPILLLHGNGESNEIFDKLIPQLNRHFTVYAIDSRGHGKSSKVKTLDYNHMAEDIAEFIKILNIDRPMIYGFSDGGIVGLILAIKYPDLLSRLMISGANVQPTGIKKKYLRIIRLIYTFTRSSKYYLMLTKPDISDEELRKITVKTLVLAGSNDIIEEEHTRHIAACIANSDLKILEGENHESYVVHSSKLYEILKPFVLR